MAPDLPAVAGTCTCKFLQLTVPLQVLVPVNPTCLLASLQFPSIQSPSLRFESTPTQKLVRNSI